MANAPQPGDGVTAAVPRPLAGPDAAEPYRPMSGLAMAGFALAALFAVAVLAGGVIAVGARRPGLLLALLVLAPLGGLLAGVLARKPRAELGKWAAFALLGLLLALGVGGLIAFSSSNPWDLHWLFWALPAAAVLVCWMAQSRIAQSEGTLEGATLARWGMQLALFFSLVYGAYALANSFAVRGQAGQAAEEFLNQIATGANLPPDLLLQDAYLRSKPEGSRPTAGARDLIEGENRVGATGAAGPFSRFKETDFVRLIALGGENNKFERVSVGWPENKNGSYHVEQIYRVTNPLATFEVELMVRSQDRVSPDGVKRRSWHVELASCKMRIIVDSEGHSRPALTLTAEGEKIEALNRAAHVAAQRWLERTATGPRGLAFLETLPPRDREAMTAAWLVENCWNEAVRADRLSPLLLLPTPDNYPAYTEALRAYEGAAALDTKDMWGVPDIKDRGVEAARRLFGPPPLPLPFGVSPTQARMPLFYRVEGDKVVLSVTVRGLATGRPPPDPQMAMMNAVLIEGELLIEAPVSAGAPDPALMRVKQFRVGRAQTAVDGPPGG